jgi:L-ribulose-5-phosphate 4-epimerase
MNEEGIKFICRWMDEKPLDYKVLKDLNTWRSRLYQAGLIGVYDSGIGYGNISMRYKRDKFIITGTATGKFKKLNSRHYTQVTAYNVEKNRVTTVGPIKASSESLTHAVLYECDSTINAVFHVHHLGLWKKLMHVAPTSKKNVEYGTTSMAREMARLFKDTALAKEKILVMAGHEEGIITFGETLVEAGEKILAQLKGLD